LTLTDLVTNEALYDRIRNPLSLRKLLLLHEIYVHLHNHLPGEHKPKKNYNPQLEKIKDVAKTVKEDVDAYLGSSIEFPEIHRRSLLRPKSSVDKGLQRLYLGSGSTLTLCAISAVGQLAMPYLPLLLLVAGGGISLYTLTKKQYYKDSTFLVIKENPEDSMICLAEKVNEEALKCTLAHEYSHAVHAVRQTLMYKDNNYSALCEGFARVATMGSALLKFRKDLDRPYLKRAVHYIATDIFFMIRCLRKDIAGGKNFKKSSIRELGCHGMYALGTASLLLARKGIINLEKKILEGDYSAFTT